MEQDPPETEAMRLKIKESLSGDLGDEEQEKMIIALFEGHLKHQMGLMNIWAGNGTGTLGGNSDVMIWG